MFYLTIWKDIVPYCWLDYFCHQVNYYHLKREEGCFVHKEQTWESWLVLAATRKYLLYTVHWIRSRWYYWSGSTLLLYGYWTFSKVKDKTEQFTCELLLFILRGASWGPSCGPQSRLKWDFGVDFFTPAGPGAQCPGAPFSRESLWRWLKGTLRILATLSHQFFWPQPWLLWTGRSFLHKRGSSNFQNGPSLHF